MITDTKLINQLQQHHLFSALDEQTLNQLMSCAHKIALKTGQTLFLQQDTADRFYFVVQGKMRLFRVASSGHEKVVDIVRTGQCFAEALMFSEKTTYPVTADALENSVVIGIENKAFKELLNNNHFLCFALMTQMSQRLHSQLNEIENLSLQNALHRLVNYLMRELEQNSGSLTLDVPKRLLASQLAIQPETLSRLLRKLTDANIISVDQKKLTLLDKQRLYDLATDNQPLRSAE